MIRDCQDRVFSMYKGAQTECARETTTGLPVRIAQMGNSSSSSQNTQRPCYNFGTRGLLDACFQNAPPTTGSTIFDALEKPNGFENTSSGLEYFEDTLKCDLQACSGTLGTTTSKLGSSFQS